LTVVDRLIYGPAAAFVAASWLLGRAAILFAALAASTALLAEAAVGVWRVGWMFERLDISLEHINES
jgi:hypothetical protein